MTVRKLKDILRQLNDNLPVLGMGIDGKCKCVDVFLMKHGPEIDLEPNEPREYLLIDLS